MSTMIRPDDRPAPPRGARRAKPVKASTKAKKPVKKAAPKRKAKDVRPPLDSFKTGITPRRLAITGGVAGLLVIIGLIASGLPGRAWSAVCSDFDQAAVNAGFAVTSVTVSGRDATTVDSILKAVGVKYGQPILGFDVDAARKRVEALSSVESASVIRRLPNEIHVSIVERVPFARWQLDGQRYVIDQDGNIITSHNINHYDGLYEIVGAGAPQAVKELVAVYKSDPVLAKRVEAAVRIGERRWNIHFKNGVVVRFPEQDFAGAWLKLSQLEASKQILDRAIDYVDLRVKNKIYIRPIAGTEVHTSDGSNT